MLTPYCHNVLKAELAKPDYDGKTADQSWAWLCVPETVTSAEDTNLPLTPLVAAKVIGPAKADVLAARVKAALPDIGESLLASGVNASDPLTAAFLNGVVGGPLLQADIDALLALGRRTVSVTGKPRFDLRFLPSLWPHVAADGTTGDTSSDAIHGFPNLITRDEFDAAWAEARG